MYGAGKSWRIDIARWLVKSVRCSPHRLCCAQASSPCAYEAHLKEVHAFQRLSGHLWEIFLKDPTQVRLFLFLGYHAHELFSISCFSFTGSRAFHHRFHRCHQNYQHEHWWSSQDLFNPGQTTACSFDSTHSWIKCRCGRDMLWKIKCFPLVSRRRINKVRVFSLLEVF